MENTMIHMWSWKCRRSSVVGDVVSLKSSRKDCCSVTQSCPTTCNPMNGSTPGFPVLHYLLEFAKPMSIQSVMPSNHLILCHALLLLPSIFLSVRVFSNELTLYIRWPKYWSFSFSISPSNEYLGWFPLGLIGLTSLLSKGKDMPWKANAMEIERGFTYELSWTKLCKFYYISFVKRHNACGICLKPVVEGLIPSFLTYYVLSHFSHVQLFGILWTKKNANLNHNELLLLFSWTSKDYMNIQEVH